MKLINKILFFFGLRKIPLYDLDSERRTIILCLLQASKDEEV